MLQLFDPTFRLGNIPSYSAVASTLAIVTASFRQSTVMICPLVTAPFSVNISPVVVLVTVQASVPVLETVIATDGLEGAFPPPVTIIPVVGDDERA